MECKKDIENLIEDIDEFKEKYVTYRTKTLRTILVKTLDHIKRKEQENDELKEKVKELRQGWVNCDKERNIQEANSEFNQRVADRYEQTLSSIKYIAEPYCNACSKFGYGKGKHCKYCNYSKILQKISEVENAR